jgi:carbon storage regulator
MLVLSRKVDERIVVGNNIRILVVSVRGNQVRLGIEAPHNVEIYREELCPGNRGTEFATHTAAEIGDPPLAT